MRIYRCVVLHRLRNVQSGLYFAFQYNGGRVLILTNSTTVYALISHKLTSR